MITISFVEANEGNSREIPLHEGFTLSVSHLVQELIDLLLVFFYLTVYLGEGVSRFEEAIFVPVVDDGGFFLE